MSKSSLKPETGPPRKSRLVRSAPTAPTRIRHKRKVAPLKASSRGWPIRLVIIVAFTAIGGLTFPLFAVGGLQLALRLREVRVPDLAGRTANEATAILEDAGLRLRLEPLSQIHQTVPAPYLLSSDNPKQELVRASRKTRSPLEISQKYNQIVTLVML